jgi:hypothetical protein
MRAWTLRSQSWANSIRSKARRPTGFAGTACLLLGLIGAGCGRDQTAVSPPLLVSVRMDALYRLHPAWPDLERLDRLAERVARSARPAAAGRMPLPEAALPVRLGVPEIRPPSADSFERVALQPAFERMEALREVLRARNARISGRESRAAAQEIETDLRRRRERLLQERWDEKARVRGIYDPMIRDLMLKTLAYRSQTLVVGLTAVRQIERSLAETEAQLRELQSRYQAELQQADNAFAQRLRDYREQREADLDRRVQIVHARLEREMQETLTSYRRALRENLEARLPLAVPSAPPHPLMSAVRLPSPAQAGATLPAPAWAEPSRTLEAIRCQRARLLQAIEEDTRYHLERLAVENRWTLVSPSAPGAADRTAAVAQMLEGAWKP